VEVTCSARLVSSPNDREIDGSIHALLYLPGEAGVVVLYSTVGGAAELFIVWQLK